MDTEKQRQCRGDNARLTESGNARSEQLLVVPTESLEWIRTSKARLVFRYDISDLFYLVQGSSSSLKWLALHCFILFDGQIDGLFHHSSRRLLLWPAKYQVNW